jgi:hypothetical protein
VIVSDDDDGADMIPAAGVVFHRADPVPGAKFCLIGVVVFVVSSLSLLGVTAGPALLNCGDGGGCPDHDCPGRVGLLLLALVAASSWFVLVVLVDGCCCLAGALVHHAAPGTTFFSIAVGNLVAVAESGYGTLVLDDAAAEDGYGTFCCCWDNGSVGVVVVTTFSIPLLGLVFLLFLEVAAFHLSIIGGGDGADGLCCDRSGKGGGCSLLGGGGCGCGLPPAAAASSWAARRRAAMYASYSPNNGGELRIRGCAARPPGAITTGRRSQAWAVGSKRSSSNNNSPPMMMAGLHEPEIRFARDV